MGIAFSEWGAVMRLARRASFLASEEQRQIGKIKDSEESSILLYTDCPTTAGIFLTSDDTAEICKTSQIEDVRIVMGENFPPASHEADRDDLELPRVAAMWFPALGAKCPRCRSYTKPEGHDVCQKCERHLANKGDRND